MIKSALKNSSGFTLIELLIVIALLGALAVGLLATVDPLEQLKKGRDTAVRNTVSEIYNGFIRYNAIKAEFPWTTDTVGPGLELTSPTGTTYLQAVIDQGELKSNFIDVAGNNLNKIYLTSTLADDNGYLEDIAVCFRPESKAFRNDDNSMYDASGVPQTPTCPDPTAPSCYWCVK